MYPLTCELIVHTMVAQIVGRGKGGGKQFAQKATTPFGLAWLCAVPLYKNIIPYAPYQAEILLVKF